MILGSGGIFDLSSFDFSKDQKEIMNMRAEILNKKREQELEYARIRMLQQQKLREEQHQQQQS